jgi:hypothetical protein
MRSWGLMFKLANRKEQFLLVSFLFLLFVMIAVTNWVNWIHGAADNTFLVQLANNIAQRGVPYSQVAYAVNVLFSEILAQPAEVVCNLDLYFPYDREFNYFKWHTYVFLYLLAPMHWVVDARHTLPVLTAFAFTGLLYFTYTYLRFRKIPPALSAMVMVLLILHPAWHQSVSGQIYNDRFFVLFGLPLLLLLHERPGHYLPLLILGTVVTSISDRFGAITGAFFIYFSLLPLLKFKSPRISLLLWGVCFAMISVLIHKFVSDYKANVSFSSTLLPSSFLLNMTSEMFAFKFKTFMMVIFTGLGFFSLMSPLFLPLLLVVIYPNAIGHVGGAEKIGFLTHYHTVYFPVLVFCSLQGFVAAYHFLERKKLSLLLYLLLFISFVLQAGVLVTRIESFNSYNSLLGSYLRAFKGPLYIASDDYRWFSTYISVIAEKMPKGSNVVTTEFSLPLVGLKHNVSIVPHGLPNADYALLPVLRDKSLEEDAMYGGSFSYDGPEDNLKQDICINQHLRSYGYDLESVERIGSWALIRRKNSRNYR